MVRAPSQRPGWLDPSIVRAAVLVVGVGYAAFGVTAVLGDVAVAFGEAPAGARPIDRIGLSGTALGIGLAVIRLAGAGSMVAAALADRYGRRRVLLVAAGVGLALTVAAAGSPGYWIFVAVVALARPLLSGVNSVTGVLAAERVATADRAKALAFVQASYAVGSGIVAVLRGVLGDVSFRTVLAASAVFVLALPLLARRMEETALFQRVESTRGRVRRRLGAVPAAVRPRLLLMATLGLSTGLVTGPAFTYLFVYGERVLGRSPGFMAVLVVLAGPIGLGGLLVGRWAADRHRRWSAASATAVFGLAGWVTYQGSVVALTGGYLAGIFAGAMMGPAVGALLAEVFPTSERGTATGWVQGAGVVGSVLGLAAFGIVGEITGSFTLAAGVLFLPTVPVALLYLRLPHTGDRELDDPETAPGDPPTPR